MASNFKDLTGKRFGSLVVINRSGTDVQGSAMWLCRCDCGDTKSIRSPSLVRGATSSCGCKQGGLVLPNHGAKFNRHYDAYKRGANKRSYSFELSPEEFRNIIDKPCKYCGEIDGLWSGVDRLDNSIGYTVTNSVPCCKFCNQAKHTNSVEYFIEKCKRIASLNTGEL